MNSFIDYLRKNALLRRFVPTLSGELEKELRLMTSILDIGCGPRPLVERKDHNHKLIGVEAFEPYAILARNSGKYDEVICDDIFNLKFAPKSFDVVLLIDVIEHVEEHLAHQLIRYAESIAIRKVIISTPNGFVSQRALDGNPLQQHLSGWSADELRELGYRTRGMAGIKWLRSEVESDEFGTNILVSIKFRPRILWFVFATLSQSITFWFPRAAFSLFAVKNF